MSGSHFNSAGHRGEVHRAALRIGLHVEQDFPTRGQDAAVRKRICAVVHGNRNPLVATITHDLGAHGFSLCVLYGFVAARERTLNSTDHAPRALVTSSVC